MLQHEQSAIPIYWTKEHARFNMILGNRQLDERKIKKIQKDIKEGLNVLRFFPILVKEHDGRLDIVDGQHRFYVARSIGSAVWYIIVNGLTLLQIAKINSNTEKWKPKDFIYLYVQNDNENYKKLQEFMDLTGFPLTTAQKLLSGEKMGTGTDEKKKDNFEHGHFEIDDYDKAVQFYEKLVKFKTFPGWKTGYFITAIEVLLKNGKCDFDDLVEKFNQKPDNLIKQMSVKNYLANLETVYNFRMQSRRTIY